METVVTQSTLLGAWGRRLLEGGLMLLYRLGGSLVGVAIYAMALRTYGPELLGKYAYASAMCTILAPLLVGGVDPTLVRELVRRPNESAELMGSAVALVLISTLVAVGIPSLYVLASDGEDSLLMAMVVGLSVGLLPNSLLVLLSYFRATSKILLATLCGLLGVALGAAFRLWAVYTHKPLYWVAAGSVFEPLLGGIALLVAYRRLVGSVFKWRMSREAVKALFLLSWSGVLAAFVGMLFYRLTHMMLKSLGSYEQLAYYAIAFQMFSVLNFLPSSAMSVVYPRLVHLHQKNYRRYVEVVRTCYVVATLVGIAMVVGVWLFAAPALKILFGARALPAASIAVVMAIANIFTFSGAVRSQVIYIEHTPVYHVYSMILGFIVLIPLNFVLIPRFGAVGAASAVAFSCFVTAIASSWVIPDLRGTGLDQSLAFLGLRRRETVPT
jgi:O-antigen/teichoic acid export membrane protein